MEGPCLLKRKNCGLDCEICEARLATGIGTKSQQALKLQQEQNKQERKVRSREQRDAKSQRLFELKQMKKKEKHRGH
jgi:hypothetical protein